MTNYSGIPPKKDLDQKNALKNKPLPVDQESSTSLDNKSIPFDTSGISKDKVVHDKKNRTS
ncbi:hypothetical protein [Azomonas macrocytogenes]|uniref:Uncharacterized protein n=1 Tax=Azomonas macrocytogenes TaxID=69962 RepID=A0A839T3Q7_AZOMA|nr:hypothetical protein [Azomonas macrocytogenes]MBB3102974.1 hypothetical protein [Azomonas macrocytogenes]